ncbi:P-loop containing nucleoside triphosphate hydrolase [Pseudocohnilembus persalinus]|uniref:p-loop containing nucleoside triphosphate hydrolase n=1 Tax=Pseudocohnilembus persalinus TaxID=266149 RepID=A0A0V0QLU7_PSEPJ|nr:P-loop containing nucleoside triphosphate hydrolase [Pseudocohnilembus persalinus]|eukprot:KRX03214.1 P-loop containing nucleoside triphosphate hydrolase [Pseudocohnilembus persalinus]
MNSNNRTLNQSKLNQSKLNKTKNPQITEEQNASIIQGWQEIEEIRKENKILREEIQVETRVQKNDKTQDISKTRRDEPNLSKIEQIQEESVQLATQIELESKKNKDLNELIVISKEEMQENKLELSKADGNALPQLQTRFKQLEYQLEKTRSKQNNSQAQIGQYKELLNSARRERVIFSNVFKKLESDLKKKDEEFKKLILEKMREDKKKEQQEEEYKKIKKDAKIEIANMQEKYQQALIDIEEDMVKERNYIVESNNKMFASETDETQQLAQKDSIINESNIPQSPHRGQGTKHLTGVIDLTSKQVDQYNFMFEKLKKQSNCKTLEEFIYNFKNIHLENDELYSQCNQKLDQIVDLQKKLQSLDQEYTKVFNEQEKNFKFIENQKLAKKGDDKKKLNEQIKITTLQNQKMATDLHQCQPKLNKLAKLLKIDLSEENLFGKSSLDLIGNIEQKISLIVNMAQFYNKEKPDVERKVTHTSVTQDERDKEINECLNKRKSGVGKSSILLRFSDDEFSESYLTTIGVDFRFKTLPIDGKKVKLQIWDTAGQERFRTITNAYYKGADGIVLVYDTTDEISFQEIEKFWLNEVQSYAEKDVELMLLGNKCDLPDQKKVDTEQSQTYADSRKMEFFETSAKANEKVEEAFISVARKLMKKRDAQLEQKKQMKKARKEKQLQSKQNNNTDNSQQQYSDSQETETQDEQQNEKGSKLSLNRNDKSNNQNSKKKAQCGGYKCN